LRAIFVAQNSRHARPAEPQLFAKRWFGLSQGRARELALNLSGAVGMAQKVTGAYVSSQPARFIQRLHRAEKSARTAQWGLTSHKRLVGNLPPLPEPAEIPLSKIRFIHVAEKTSAPAGPGAGRKFLKRGGAGVVLVPVVNFLSRVQGCHQSCSLRQVGKWRLCFRLRNFLAALYLPIAI
jgi:hypothetical protein